MKAITIEQMENTTGGVCEMFVPAAEQAPSGINCFNLCVVLSNLAPPFSGLICLA